LARLPADAALDTPDEGAERLMANLLDWHWRESKQTWWEHFRALELPPAECFEDRSVLADLAFVGVVGKEKKSNVCRYEFRQQEHSIKLGSDPVDPDTEKGAGEVLALGDDFVHLKRGPSQTTHPSALIASGPLNTKAHAARLLAIGRSIAEQGIAASDSFRSARELLLRRAPRCGQKPQNALVNPGEDTVLAISRLALGLDHSVLAVQGPPGSGKTHRAAEMILSLVKAGKRVGVTSNSHRVIKGVLRKVSERAAEAEQTVAILHIDDDEEENAPFEFSKDYPGVRARLDAGSLNVVGGTSWAWVNDRLENAIDVLVVDEAGQMSLANVLSVSTAAESMILFGDPAQLDQPQKGAHPPGAEASALEHLLGDALTMPADRGVFLPETRRLCPAICQFTSRVFYDGRLESVPGLERQRIVGPSPFDGSGLRFVPVIHRGNTNQSDEYPDVLDAGGAAVRAERARRARSCSLDGKPGLGHHRFCGLRHRWSCMDLGVLSPHDRAVSWRRRREHSSGTLAGRGASLDWPQLDPRRPGRDLLVGSPERHGEARMNPGTDEVQRLLPTQSIDRSLHAHDPPKPPPSSCRSCRAAGRMRSSIR
jgi:uncharacterized protein